MRNLKFLSLLGSLILSGLIYADEVYINDINNFSNDAAKLIELKMQSELPAKLWESRLTAYPNTFTWYKWQDYDSASAWQRISILKLLNQLSTIK